MAMSEIEPRRKNQNIGNRDRRKGLFLKKKLTIVTKYEKQTQYIKLCRY